MTLLPCMVEKTLLFVNILDQYAASGQHFMLNELCTNLTFDIIGETCTWFSREKDT
jgi:hypothetical protein